MPYIQDTTQSFTITLTALLEGLAEFVQIYVTNNTSGIQYVWNYATGLWTPSTPEAVEADSITIVAEISNRGAVSDIMFGEFVSAQVIPTEIFIQEAVIGVGFAGTVGTWNFTMPPNSVSITINAGHVEGGEVSP